MTMLIKDYSTDSKEVLDFCNSVLAECSADIKEWYSDPKRIQRYDYCSLMYDGQGNAFASSFVENINKWWRVGQIHYVLKEYRNKYPSAMLKVDGFLDYHWNKLEGNGIFFSIHTYSRRMRIQAQMMHDRLINTHRENLTPLRDRILALGEHQLRYVPQEIFVLSKVEFAKEDFLNAVL
mgnify:CR=1 FL=1